MSRLQHLKKLNGMKIEEHERKDCEVHYMKLAFEEYLVNILKAGPDNPQPLDTVRDPGLATYVNEIHPRFYELVSYYGSPLELVNLKNEGKNIAQTSAKIELVSFVPKTEGKTLTKKLLLSMTVTALKAMCSKLFKVDVLE